MKTNKAKNWYDESPIDEKAMFATGMLHTAIEACLNIESPGDDIASTLMVAERILEDVHKELLEKNDEPKTRQS
jgi:hypothetical protein